MTNTASIDELSRRIEQLVAEHIAATRKAAQEAVMRAFGGAELPAPAVKLGAAAAATGGNG